MKDGGGDDLERVADLYRRAMEGHVDIGDTMDALLDAVGERIGRHRPHTRILHLGSHAGVVAETFLRRWPEAVIAIHDEDEDLIAMARRRLAGRSVEYYTGPIASISCQVDLVVSIARHHHLPHDYLEGLRLLMKPDAVYLLADELCPEYCEGEHRRRIERADVIHMAGGYVLTSRAEVAAFERTGGVPSDAHELEQLRRRALWRWYRFVIDHAVMHGYFDVAVGELQSTLDDFITGSDAEHKFSPLIVERQFALAGFRQLSKRSIGSPSDPALQSMFVYEYGVA